MWTSFFFALTAMLCLLCLTGCIFVAQGVRAERESLQERLRSCESKLKLQSASLEELREIAESMAQSQKMSRVRKATTHALGSSGEPDVRTDPEGWRAWQNRQLRPGVIN
jgi:hypothetical protein